MRLLHTGDLHYSGGVDEDIEISMSQITEHVKQNHIDFVTIGGDVYDKSSSIESRNIVKERLMKIAGYAPIIICRGNHDQPGDLDILADLKATHPIKVYSSPTVVNLGEGVNLYAIPWVSKHHWMEAHKVDSIDELNSTLSGQLLNYITSLRKCNKWTANHHIVLAHILISGARAENNQPLIGEGITLGEFDLEEGGFHAGFLSHIHLRQQFGNGNFFYSGSPAALDFGETQDKYYSVYDVGSNSVEWFKLNAVRRICVDGNWREGQWNPNSDAGDLSGARLKVTYPISPTDDNKLISESIRQYYASSFLKELKLSPIVEQKMAARADNVSSAKSLEEKLKEYWKHTGQELSNCDSIMRKLKRAEDTCLTQKFLFEG
jgi:exonuclease SbcD